jgi:WD40 repeat protein
VTGAFEDTTQVKVSIYLNMVATGSRKGEVALWNFETNQISAILTGHTDEITSLEFLEPYPLLLTAGRGGRFNIWDLKTFECYFSFQNLSVPADQRNNPEAKLQRCGVKQLQIYKADTQIKDTNVLPHQQLISPDIYRDFKSTYLFSSFEEKIQMKKDGVTFCEPMEIESKRRQLVAEYSKIGDLHGQSRRDVEFAKIATVRKCLSKRFSSHNFDDNLFDYSWIYLYIGDEAGMLKIFDLTGPILATGVQAQEKPYFETRECFPERRGNFSAHIYRDYLL